MREDADMLLGSDSVSFGDRAIMSLLEHRVLQCNALNGGDALTALETACYKRRAKMCGPVVDTFFAASPSTLCLPFP